MAVGEVGDEECEGVGERPPGQKVSQVDRTDGEVDRILDENIGGGDGHHHGGNRREEPSGHGHSPFIWPLAGT